jgi:hypothetical protein
VCRMRLTANDAGGKQPERNKPGLYLARCKPTTPPPHSSRCLVKQQCGGCMVHIKRLTHETLTPVYTFGGSSRHPEHTSGNVCKAAAEGVPTSTPATSSCCVATSSSGASATDAHCEACCCSVATCNTPSASVRDSVPCVSGMIRLYVRSIFVQGAA